MPFLTVITPCLNAGALLGKTVESVRSEVLQNPKHRIEHLIIDGKSEDGSGDYLRSLADPHLRIISEEDTSLFDAVSKGLRLARGDFIIILGAGDLLIPGATQEIELHSKGRQATWASGRQLFHDQSPENRALSRRGPKVFRYLAKKGAYGSFLPPIQQESTFFSRGLIEFVPLETLATYALAGDSFIWACLAGHVRHSRLDAAIGSFLIHSGQLSENKKAYQKETENFRGQPRSTIALFAMSVPVWLDLLASFALVSGNRKIPVRRCFGRSPELG